MQAKIEGFRLPYLLFMFPAKIEEMKTPIKTEDAREDT
jgi:hypothetical protein